MALHFINSEKGKRMLVVDNYIFHRHKGTEEKEFWRCSDRSCKSRCQTSNGVIVKQPTEHSEASSSAKVEVAQIRSTLKERAKETEEPGRNLVKTATQNLHPTTQATLPREKSLKRTIRAYRQVKSQDGSGLTDGLRETTNGQPFLRHEENFLLFAADRDLDFLVSCSIWFADGTFKVSPAQYTQLYTIHGTRNGIHIPCAFALLPDKRESTYTAVLEKLKDLRPLLEPHTVITDFEQAAMNSFKNVFGAQLHGCHFHFGQCVWCKVQENGCAAQYHTDKNFSMHIRMLVALAYVPLADKGRVYNKLVKLESFPEVDPLLGYFEETFIGRQKRKVRSIPLFAPRDLGLLPGGPG